MRSRTNLGRLGFVMHLAFRPYTNSKNYLIILGVGIVTESE